MNRNVLPWVPRDVFDALKVLEPPSSSSLLRQLALTTILVAVEDGRESWLRPVAARIAREHPSLSMLLYPTICDRHASAPLVTFAAFVVLLSPLPVPDAVLAAIAERSSYSCRPDLMHFLRDLPDTPFLREVRAFLSTTKAWQENPEAEVSGT